MAIDKHLRVGDRAQISINGVFHNTIVSDILDENTFLITDIWYMQRKVQLFRGNIHPIVCITRGGLVMFDVEVEGPAVYGNLTLVKVISVSEPTVTQRRQTYRVKVMLDARITEIPEIIEEETGEEPEQPFSFNTLTLDISESGMQFLTDKQYHPGDKLLCSVDINKFGITANRIELVGEVLRCRPPAAAGGQFRVGIRFMKLPESVRSKLARFIIASQVKK